MALVNKPDESIFASSAKQGEVDNFPDLLRGWGVTFDQTQGIPPMEWFNFLFKRLDEKHTYLMQRGLPEWSATQDYTKGSCVQFDGVSYRALKDSKNNRPNESESQYWVRWGFTLSEIARATLTQYGVTQLYTGYDSQSEDLALTPKTAYQLKQLIDSNTRSLGNFIPNSKKSSAVNSNSADTVATSAAVKTANDNANGRVSKSGDTMTGNLTVPNIIVNDPTNNNNSVQIGDDTKLIDVDMGHTVGLQTTDNANDAYIAYGATKKRFGFDGVNFKADSGIAAQWYQSDAKGHGAFGEQWRDKTAPYVVSNPNANGSNIYFPFIKGFNTNGNLYGTAFSFGYMTPGHINQFGSGVIHLIEDNGSDKYWWFDHDGKLRADEFEAKGKRLSKAHQSDDKYVDVASQDNYGGLRIRKPDGKLMIFEREGDKFKYWAQDLYEIYLPQKSGTLMLDSDISYQKIGNFGVTKYPDGTMIQTYFFERYDLAGFFEKSFNWAVSFTDNPVIIPKIRTSISAAHDCGLNILTKSNGSTCYYHEYEHQSLNQGQIRVEFLAIGRWK